MTSRRAALAVLLVRPLGVLTLALLLFARPSAAEAQEGPRVWRVEVLANTALESSFEGFRDGLRDLGYVEGRNLVLNVTSSPRFEQLPQLAAVLVKRKPDAIVAFATNALEAAKTATQTIPIVMVRVAEPARYVTSLSHPGGNITGVGNVALEIAGKRIELLKEAVPRLARVAALTHASAAIHRRYLEVTRAAATRLGLTVQVVEVRDAGHLPSALADIERARVGAMLPFPDGMFNAHRRDIIGFANAKRLPTMYTEREWANDGAFMSYGPNYRDHWRSAAIYVDKLLKGAKPADLPIEEPTKLELIINLKTAKTLGLTIPPSLLLRADQVIE